MKSVILVHGSPDRGEYYDTRVSSPSNSHWFPWVQRQCLLQDILCQAPEFPKPYEPVYEDYLKVLKQFDITNESVLVGHSSGAGVLLRYLLECPELVPQRVVLVAPWLDPERELSSPIFDFEIDNELVNRTDIHVMISRDDDAEVRKSCEHIEAALSGITMHRFNDKGHFTESSIGKEFPELLEIILK